MKFEKWFSEHKLDAWRHSYLRFNKMKNILKDNRFDSFVITFKAEVSRVGSFFSSILELHRGRWVQAKEALAAVSRLKAGKVRDKELFTQKELVEGMYAGLMHLHEYARVNYRAAARLLVRAKKAYFAPQVIEELKGALVIDNKLQNRTGRLMQEIQHTVAQIFFSGSLRSAKLCLKSWSHNKQLTSSDTFWLGLFIGLTLMIVATTTLMCFLKGLTADTDPHFKVVFPMFRCLMIFSLYAFLLGCNVYTWNSHCINFKQLLGFRLNFSPATKFLMRGAMIGSIVIACFYWYVLDRLGFLENQRIHDYFTPLFAWAFIILWLFYPIKKWLSYSGRTFLLRIIAQSIVAPFSKVEFKHVFVMDQVISLVVPFKDLEYSICFIASGGVESLSPEYCGQHDRIFPLMLTLIPYLIRTLQCCRLVYEAGTWRHVQVLNAGKYLSSVAVIIINFVYLEVGSSLLPLWVGFSLFSTLYSFIWDVRQDWGLLRPGFLLLRRKLLYKPTVAYYGVIVFNLLLRLSWTLTLSPVVMSTFVVPELLTLVTGILEAYRRIQWNFFRMEWEQLVTVGYTYTAEVKHTMSQPLAPFAGEEFEDLANINSKLVYYRSLVDKSSPKSSEMSTFD